jgi:hypothetical protein
MAPKHVTFQISPQFVIYSIKSSIAILFSRINSIASLPNSNVSPEVGRLFHFGSSSWIYAISPLMNHQTFNLFQFGFEFSSNGSLEFDAFCKLILGCEVFQFSA